MHILKSVGVMSVAKLMGLLYGCLGLIFAPIFLLIGLLGSFAGSDKTPLAGVFGVCIRHPYAGFLRSYGIRVWCDWRSAL
jgi:hypothetical protein